MVFYATTAVFLQPTAASETPLILLSYAEKGKDIVQYCIWSAEMYLTSSLYMVNKAPLA